jgi:hypothetical protein
MIIKLEGFPIGLFKLSDTDLEDLQNHYLSSVFDVKDDDICEGGLKISKNRSQRWDNEEYFKKYNDTITPYIQRYVDSYMFQFPYSIKIDTWYNVHKQYDHQTLHNHITTNVPAFSCAVILKQPNENAGQFCFHTPNLSNHLKYLELDPMNRYPNVFEPKMEDGAMILFPSCLDHYVTYNETKEYRAVFASNIIIKRTSSLF